MVNIIVKQSYNHINSSLPGWDTPKGRYVKNKDHYDRLCKESGMVSFEQAQEIADKARSTKIKDYKPSKEALEIIKAAKNSSDKNGNVKLSDRTIEAMIKKKAIGQKIPDYMKLPELNKEKGGFYSDNNPKKEYAQGFTL